MGKEYLYQKINSKTDIDKLIKELKKEKIKSVFRETYEIKSKNHSYVIQEIEKSKPKGEIRRREEWICKLSLDKILGKLGKVIDYQVPLKVPGYKIENEGRGKIDLLTVKGNTLYMIEYKRFSNNENPLKAISEIYTYYKMLCEGHQNKISNKFFDRIRNPQKSKIKNCIPVVLLTKEDSGDRKIENNVFTQLKNNRKLLRKSKKLLGVECYYCSVDGKTLVIDESSIKSF